MTIPGYTGRRTRPWLRPAGAAACLLLLLAALFACNKGDNTTPSKSVSAVNILVAESGLYAVDRDSVEEVGLALQEWDHKDLNLTHDGTSIPFLLDGETMLFYGQAPADRYSATRVYQLAAGEPGRRFSESVVNQAAHPQSARVSQSLRLEENRTYIADISAEADQDRWFWQRLGQGQQASFDFDIDAQVDGAGTVRFGLWGSTHNPQIDMDHDFDLYLNGSPLGVVRWEGQTRYVGQIPFPSGLLKRGKNQLLLDNEVPGASFLDIMELDWLELTYEAAPEAIGDQLRFSSRGASLTLTGFSDRPVLLDISDGSDPLRLDGWVWNDGQIELEIEDGVELLAIGPDGWRMPAAIQPRIEGSLRDVANQADFIIITTGELAPAVEPLAAAREEAGISTVVATVGEIYDTFGFGAATPDSIQGFLKYAVREWQSPSPRYLLIVGDATSDYRNYLRISPNNVIPAPMVPVAYGGETVSDGRMADVDGDLRADLAVGRWPVSEIEQVESLVERTLAYELGSASALTLFTVDDSERRFAEMADYVASAGGQSPEQSEMLVGGGSLDVAGAWNEGAWLVTYIGHGSVQQWGKDELFNLEAVSMLETSNPPIVLQLTCLTGLFAHPELPSLSETMLLHSQGPVILIAATSLTLSTFQEPFAIALMDRLVDPSLMRIGDVFHAAKNSLDIEASSGLREINDTFVLLGDPSALIVRPPS